MPARLHADQVDVSVDQVRALVAGQFPQWRDLRVAALPAHGTVNALFRVGSQVVVRMPLVPSAADDEVRAEQDNARSVATRVSVAVPEPLGIGGPGAGYRGAWAAYRWIDGSPATPADADVRFAEELATFVLELRRGGAEDVHPGFGTGRGGPLIACDRDVREAMGRCGDEVDAAAVFRLWSDCLAADRGDTPDTALHADLMPGNLLVAGGRLVGVLDLGPAETGDPAVDLMPAWNLFEDPVARAAFRGVSGVDDATWRRGRGWALVQAICALPYYRDTFPAMAETARHTIATLLAESLPG